jgi:hypothetical protein
MALEVIPMTYDAADAIAVQLVNSGRHRIVFVTEDITVAHELRYDYAVMNYGIVGMVPVKRYRRLTITAALVSNQPLIEVKAVNSWRRS